MSNPAVTKLVRANIGKSGFWMDDNIGEAVHIHLSDFRLDLSISEFNTLVDELNETINCLVGIDGFDCNHIDPVFFQSFFYKYIPYLKSVGIDEVYVGDLVVSHGIGFGRCKYERLQESRAVKALNGNSSENDDNRQSHHIGQSSNDRLERMKKSIEQNGYGYNGNLIILYEDQMLVQDGQHRAACIYNSLGNVKIPVFRFYYHELPEELRLEKRTQIKQIYMAIKRHRGIKARQAIVHIAKEIYHVIRRVKCLIYKNIHKQELKELTKVYYIKKG